MELLSEPIITVAICTNFYPEVASLCQQGELPGIDLVSGTASCERPIKSWNELAQQLPELNPSQPLLVIGSCLPNSLPDPPPDFHTLCLHNLDQCFNLIAGKTLTARLIHQKAYLISSGWLEGWADHLRSWGFQQQETAQLFFQDCASNIVLLDTGIFADSDRQLAAFANYVGLPASQIWVGLDYLAAVLRTLVSDTRNRHLQTTLTQCQEQTAHYALALSLLDELTGKTNVEDVVADVADLFKILFAPQEVIFHTASCDSAAAQETTPAYKLTEKEQTRLEAENYVISQARDGFWISLRAGDLFHGYLEIVGLSLPAYLERYLNLAITIAPLCTLAINKARYTEKMQEEIEVLRSLLPLRSFCKKIRDERGNWQEVAAYIPQHHPLDISHGICPGCAEKHYPEYFSRLKK